jgi:hypothetical protein
MEDIQQLPLPTTTWNKADLDLLDKRYLIGKGAMGEVYRGKYQGKYVAVKVPLKDSKVPITSLVEALEREAKLVGLCHNNLVKLLGYDPEEQLLCIGKYSSYLPMPPQLLSLPFSSFSFLLIFNRTDVCVVGRVPQIPSGSLEAPQSTF